jgi:predicted ATPase with chaperone activity
MKGCCLYNYPLNPWVKSVVSLSLLARTIEDLASAENIGPAYLAEAIQHRPKRIGM